MKAATHNSKGTLREWSVFLTTLSAAKSSGKPLLKKAEIPGRMLAHLESKLAPALY